MDRLLVNMLRVMPLRSYTRLIYLAARIPVPRGARRAVYSWLGARFGMDLREAELALSDYPCFQDLFVRRLQAGRRPQDPSPEAVTSPVDAKISEMGTIHSGCLIQAKGIQYPVEELLKDQALAARMDGGTFATLYLRPRDYHRIHSPLDATVCEIRHVPGTLFPVQPYMVRGLAGLFTRNERVVLELDTAAGKAALVCVAASGVGNISLALDREQVKAGGQKVDRGQEVAAFNLGSTVILVFAAGAVSLEGLSPGQEIRVGQRIGALTGADVASSN